MRLNLLNKEIYKLNLLNVSFIFPLVKAKKLGRA